MTEYRVEVRALTVNKRQLSVAFFRQLPEMVPVCLNGLVAFLLESSQGAADPMSAWYACLDDLDLSTWESGKVWGWLRVGDTTCVIFDRGGVLFRGLFLFLTANAYSFPEQLAPLLRQELSLIGPKPVIPKWEGGPHDAWMAWSKSEGEAKKNLEVWRRQEEDIKDCLCSLAKSIAGRFQERWRGIGQLFIGV